MSGRYLAPSAIASDNSRLPDRQRQALRSGHPSTPSRLYRRYRGHGRWKQGINHELRNGTSLVLSPLHSNGSDGHSPQRSPMPHSRLQLRQTKANAYDLDGKLISRNVPCEQRIVAGWNASVLYNRIL